MAKNQKPHQSDIDELQRMFSAEDLRSKRPRFWRRKLARTLSVVNLTLIMGVAIYLLVVYGWRLLQWLELGRPRKIT